MPSGGWRGSHAYPAALLVPEVHINGRRLTGLESMAMQLADYGVPVRICDGMSARDLVDHLAARTASWRRERAA